MHYNTVYRVVKQITKNRSLALAVTALFVVVLALVNMHRKA